MSRVWRRWGGWIGTPSKLLAATLALLLLGGSACEFRTPQPATLTPLEEVTPTSAAVPTTSGSPKLIPVGVPPTPTPSTVRAAEAVDGYIVFLNEATYIRPSCGTWPDQKVQALAQIYEHAVFDAYAAREGFESVNAWAAAFGLSKARPLIIVYDPDHPLDPQPSVTQYEGTPVIVYGKTIRVAVARSASLMAIHELAHVWDAAHGWALSAAMVDIVDNPSNYPTAKARENPREDFAESVTAYLRAGYAVNERWSDDDVRFYHRYGEGFDDVWSMDRHDYVARLFAGDSVEGPASQNETPRSGTEPVSETSVSQTNVPQTARPAIGEDRGSD